MRKRRNPESEPNIRRIDTKPRAKKQTHGYQVHFLRGDKIVTKLFSDSVYGGKRAARRAARKFRDAVLRRLPRRKPVGLRSARATPLRTPRPPERAEAVGEIPRSPGRPTVDNCFWKHCASFDLRAIGRQVAGESP